MYATQKNRWVVAAFGTRGMTRTVARAPPAHTWQARLWWDSQAGGLAAAGTSLDWPYWALTEWFLRLPSCRLSDSKGPRLGLGRSGLSGGPYWGHFEPLPV